GCLVLVAVLQLTACSVAGAEPSDILTAWTAPHASSPQDRSPLLAHEMRRLLAAAATQDSALAPWQRESMLGMARAGRAGLGGGEPEQATPTDREALSSADGTWLQEPPPTTREGHSAIYDPVRDRMVVFGGFGGGFYFNHLTNDVWALSLTGRPTWTQL